MIEVEVKLPAADLDSIKEKLLKQGLKKTHSLKNMTHTLTMSRVI